MLLSTKIKLDCGGVLSYSLNPKYGTHCVYVDKGCGQSDLSAPIVFLPGEAINLLGPHRDANPEVQELIRWLSNLPSGQRWF
ncbi:hypothetical protein CG716_05090 [Mycolicibacterium sphagni]|uniref:Uncharacterized protein n=1 Tax=Mycolicibacterium sphagni TaxID=1786 RepID=A0A255DSR4_9MYCO|nr:hypothetical protein CG716_05090 [Mycolicibacterium sphagni]